MTQSIYELLDWQALNRITPTRWLVDGHLPEAGLATLTGKSGVGKTFLALDLALSVSTGTPWHGCATVKGPAVLIAAEGSNGIKSRVHAWLEARDLDDPGSFHVIGEPVNLSVPGDVDKLLATLAELPESPRLVIFDTLARSMVGADENSATGMGLVVDQAGRIQRATGATVLLVHHTGHSNERERGSSALPAAVDTAIHAKESQRGRAVDVSCHKMKDAAPFSTLVFELATSGSSLVPRLGARPAAEANGGPDRRTRLLQVIAEAGEPLSMRAIQERAGGRAELNREAVNALVDDEAVPVTRDAKGRIVYVPLTDGGSPLAADTEENH